MHDCGAISAGGGGDVIGLHLSSLVLPLEHQGGRSNLMHCVAEAPIFGDPMTESLLATSGGCGDTVISSLFLLQLADVEVSPLRMFAGCIRWMLRYLFLRVILGPRSCFVLVGNCWGVGLGIFGGLRPSFMV